MSAEDSYSFTDLRELFIHAELRQPFKWLILKRIDWIERTATRVKETGIPERLVDRQLCGLERQVERYARWGLLSNHTVQEFKLIVKRLAPSDV